jgi:hypothetical protein
VFIHPITSPKSCSLIALPGQSLHCIQCGNASQILNPYFILPGCSLYNVSSSRVPAGSAFQKERNSKTVGVSKAKQSNILDAPKIEMTGSNATHRTANKNTRMTVISHDEKCCVCNKAGSKKYGVCLVLYCSKECQQAHWRSHKEGCTTAGHNRLIAAIEQHHEMTVLHLSKSKRVVRARLQDEELSTDALG